jgi:phosphoribosylformylglycinamidine synthase subunit PurS
VRYRAEVVISLKPGLADPQGKAVESALPTLGWPGVTEVHVGKYVTLTVQADTEAEAVAAVAAMSERFLSNPVIEDHRIVSVAPAGGLAFGSNESAGATGATGATP